MNELDYAVVALLAISVTVGVVRGAVREILNVAGWIFAVLLARTFAQNLALYFADWMAEPVYRVIFAWLAIFMLVLAISGLLASLISELMRKLGLGGLNRTMGGLIGLVRGVLVVLVLTLASGMTTFPQSAMWKNASVSCWLEVAALHVRAFLPENLASRITYRMPKLQQS